MKQPRITLYSAPGCAHCRQARKYPQEQGLRFQEFDVQRNARAGKELQRMGARGVPVIMVGEQRIDGFQPRLIASALRRAGGR